MQIVLDFIGDIAWWGWGLIVLGLIAIRDLFFQKKHTIQRNFPIVGHIRYMLETIGPELRQYIVANNREELPFNRIERSWIYASAKKQNNYQGFGTDQDLYAPGHIFINPAMIPYMAEGDHPNVKDPTLVPCAKLIGGPNGRKRPYRPRSIINISAMSYGSLSAPAIEALNKGAHLAGCYHNTGEGGLSPYHSNGADVMFHFGTGYFGVRGKDGKFSMDKMVELVEKNPFIRAIEVKLSQGAKPGKGGVLPAKKITPEIAKIRGVELGKDVLSPTRHTAFASVPEMLDLIEAIAEKTGLPVGIKSAIGKLESWEELTDEMLKRGTGPDFITIDGGEGGTGAAPPAFAAHVALPLVYAFTDIYRLFLKKGLTDKVAFIASGKLGMPARGTMAFAMGADVIQVARESMIAIGCIQAQKCHNNTCPTGVATNNKWLQSGLFPDQKAQRFYQYAKSLRKEMLEITHACGYEHPAQLNMRDVDMGMGDNNATIELADIYRYEKAAVPFESVAALAACPHLGGIKNEQ